MVKAATLPADYTNPILTSMPSVGISPDARGAGLGDQGVATTPDLNSQYWNVAKYAAMNDESMGYGRCRGGLTANYTPWLRKLVGDIDLAYLAGFYNISERAGAVSASFSYFSMGDVQMTNLAGDAMAEVRPNEWSLSFGYSRKLHEYVSMGVALTVLYSDMNNGVEYQGGQDMHAACTAAADLGLYYNQPIDLPMGTSYFRLGFTLKNMGGKMTYNDVTSNFIPTTANLGISYELPINKYNLLTFSLETGRYMVPSQKSRYTKDYDENNPSTWRMDYTKQYSKINPVKGFFQSFNDAPGGALEEFKEQQWHVGLEYTYNRQFFGRVGYAHEDKTKGNRRLVQVGAGFHLSIVSVDFAYTIATAPTNPLDQTMRFTLGFDLAGIKDLVDNRR